MTDTWLSSWLTIHHDELVAMRRQLHTHPELGFAEHRTTELIVERLTAAGLHPRVLPRGTGVAVDIGSGPRTVGLRADIDALPLADVKDVPYRSGIDGVCHACGHDAHTAMAVGAALALADVPQLPGRVRVIFQPAEEIMGGAREVVAAGELDDVERIFALHCDPRLPVGQLGLRPGPITAACDLVEVHISGPGGHTARPQLTVDVVDTLARIAADTPALLARQIDIRSGLSLVWGAIQAGSPPNAIPSEGVLRGTVRVLDHAAWADAEKHVRTIVSDIAAQAGAGVEVHYERGVPPVVNDDSSVALMHTGISAELGERAITGTQTSMGGEDFAWYGERVPLAMARLGVHGNTLGTMRDLHQGNFDLDEQALGHGVRALVGTALAALGPGVTPA
ncbi:amidohydrolase [Haloactinopolyspora alba]|uniref:Amidohydrolase n=1 Tax=Haloactinopolyspora alba TaxID=648780 RepID=A0A2P8DPF9_9ACTN|nr:amidohydrolase [Haloactinopolyspora alba]PSK99105.1 amidohydrolase [Haloactinopolyspora alba]